MMMYVCVAMPDLVWGHQLPGSCGLGPGPCSCGAESQTRAARGQAVPTGLLGSPCLSERQDGP